MSGLRTRSGADGTPGLPCAGVRGQAPVEEGQTSEAEEKRYSCVQLSTSDSAVSFPGETCHRPPRLFSLVRQLGSCVFQPLETDKQPEREDPHCHYLTPPAFLAAPHFASWFGLGTILESVTPGPARCLGRSVPPLRGNRH